MYSEKEENRMEEEESVAPPEVKQEAKRTRSGSGSGSRSETQRRYRSEEWGIESRFGEEGRDVKGREYGTGLIWTMKGSWILGCL